MTTTPSLAPGLAAERHLVVDAGRTIGFLGEALRVYATPQLVNDMEHACLDLLLPYLAPGENSVGSEVSLHHLAATPLGAPVCIRVAVVAVEGRRVRFDFSASDDLQQIAIGTHSRGIVDVQRLAARMARRAAGGAAAGPTSPASPPALRPF